MSNLTRIPVSMLDGGALANSRDHLVTDELGNVLLTPENEDADARLVSGSFDPATGILHLRQSDNSVVTITGLLTQMNIGVGPVGPTGPQGKPGSNGRNGKDGRQGLMGCSGPKGDPGPMGPTGPAGLSGGPGSQGATGPKGEVGPTGPAGLDGKTPVFGYSDSGAFEQYKGSSIKQWGFFSAPTSSALFQRVLLPTPFNNDDVRAVLLQFKSAKSAVRNAVSVTALNRANFELMVDQTLLEQVSDGEGATVPVAATGWEFYWFVIGADE